MNARFTWISIGLATMLVGYCRAEEPPTHPYFLTFSTNRFGDRFNLVTIDLKGKNESRLTHDPRAAMEPAWSPDGKWVAFTSYRDAKSQIYIQSAAGGDPQNLTKSTARERSPAWSPDGRKISFTSQRDGNQEIYAMDANGSHPTDLTNNEAYETGSAWSPDGKKIVFGSNRTGDFRLWMMNTDGTNPEQVSDLDLGGWVYPAWSPDSRTIAFGGITQDAYQVHVLDLKTGKTKQISEEGGVNSYAAWSPDGRYLAYVHFDDPPRSGGQADPAFHGSEAGGVLMVFEFETGKRQKVSEGDLPAWGPRPTWRPILKGLP